MGIEPWTHPAGVLDLVADHHLLAGLAVGVDRDHRDLYADLYPLAREVRYRSIVLWTPGRAESADRVLVAACGHVGLLSEGGCATPCHAESDLRGHDAVYGHPDRRGCPALHVPGNWYVVADGPVPIVVSSIPAPLGVGIDSFQS